MLFNGFNGMAVRNLHLFSPLQEKTDFKANLYIFSKSILFLHHAQCTAALNFVFHGTKMLGFFYVQDVLFCVKKSSKVILYCLQDVLVGWKNDP